MFARLGFYEYSLHKYMFHNLSMKAFSQKGDDFEQWLVCVCVCAHYVKSKVRTQSAYNLLATAVQILFLCFHPCRECGSQIQMLLGW